MTLDNIKEEIEKADSICLLTHENPDGDAIGSSLALYIALKRMGKNVDIIIPEMPKTYRFLPYVNEIKINSQVERYDLAIALDSATIKMLNGFAKYFETAKTKITIDHHSINTMFGDYNFVNPDSPACAQVLIVVLSFLGVEIDVEIGTCLLTGIITDTGGFQYSGVTAETFEFAASLLKKGVKVSEIYKKAMNTKTKPSFELYRTALSRMEFLEDGKIAFTYINNEDMEKYNADVGDREGIVEAGRSVEGVEVSCFLRETEKGYKFSLRSNEKVNVAKICLAFGGGGHIKAAGCNINEPFEVAKIQMINEIKKYL